MDRQIVYPGAIPLDTDLLHIQRHILQALGALTRCVLGAGPVADGLLCTPGAGLSVSVGPGSLTSEGAADALPFGSLPADGSALVRTGVNAGPVAVAVPGAVPGLFVRHLLQARAVDVDEAPVALPYWNAADPSVPWSGPGNSGLPQYTRRVSRVQLAIKPGLSAPPGTEAHPAADAGWVGLCTVTVRGAAGTILPEDVRRLPGAPYLPFRLPQLAPGFSRVALFGAAGAWVVPAGVRLARVRLVGAGGGGGGGSATSGGGGGGAGGYAELLLPVAPGDALPVVIGAGGPGGTPGITGAAGGATSFAGGTVAASGGSGGSANNPDCAGGAAGYGTAGGLILRGGFGTDGCPVPDVPAGSGGASVWGGGGRGAIGGGLPTNGQAPGSGAGGGYGAGAVGGTGAAGLVVVEY